MADRLAAVRTRMTPLARMMLLAILAFSVVLMAGCKSVPMPDMSKFNLDDLLKDKPVVAIKAGYSTVNIRPTPSTSQPPVAALKGGDKVKLYEERGNWLKVTFYKTTGEEQEGWIYKYLVEGYHKTSEAGIASSGSDASDMETESTPEPEILEVEKTTSSNQELPKSESVSPL